MSWQFGSSDENGGDFEALRKRFEEELILSPELEDVTPRDVSCSPEAEQEQLETRYKKLASVPLEYLFLNASHSGACDIELVTGEGTTSRRTTEAKIIGKISDNSGYAKRLVLQLKRPGPRSTPYMQWSGITYFEPDRQRLMSDKQKIEVARIAHDVEDQIDFGFWACGRMDNGMLGVFHPGHITQGGCLYYEPAVKGLDEIPDHIMQAAEDNNCSIRLNAQTYQGVDGERRRILTVNEQLGSAPISQIYRITRNDTRLPVLVPKVEVN